MNHRRPGERATRKHQLHKISHISFLLFVRYVGFSFPKLPPLLLTILAVAFLHLDMDMDNNLLESLLDLEEDFYKEGYDLGAADGAEAGYTEGSVFAVEKGFEKFLELGRLYGKALVWAQRLASANPTSAPNSELSGHATEEVDDIFLGPSTCKGMASFPHSSRLAKNLDTLLELVDPASLPMENTEEAVTDVDERLKGAVIKAKLIQRALGEREDTSDIHSDARGTQAAGDGTGSIEDISSLSIRH
ncbi:hypothetical protein BJX68DRAFT_180874 [Aspergillus pseudodeflectus]|uniref:Essential protein Yae1 N-terminal domain-containing protein n=2 Tax=Aspergillus subgen. Nidulantes TaxID=2720870 RepID=A0ABR4JMJ4_9EURO|nr:Putative DUF1715 domain protein [Aspergillus calidoustus]